MIATNCVAELAVNRRELFRVRDGLDRTFCESRQMVGYKLLNGAT
jgi:hypothetical protein